jgi:octaprenyl-diphosphate synthase
MHVVRARLKSSVALVDQVAAHIITGGGKRLRPLLVVLAGRACGKTSEGHIEAAAFIEFIHTATLLHDDVVDSSSKRRGRARRTRSLAIRQACWSGTLSTAAPFR